VGKCQQMERKTFKLPSQNSECRNDNVACLVMDIRIFLDLFVLYVPGQSGTNNYGDTLASKGILVPVFIHDVTNKNTLLHMRS
jgi:hypothetical protein